MAPQQQPPLGAVSPLPAKALNKILSSLLHDSAPIQIKLVRQQKGLAHGQNASISPPGNPDYKALMLVCRRIEQGRMWNYLQVNITSPLEIVMLWTGPPPPPVLRIKNFATYITRITSPIAIVFHVNRTPQTHLWADEAIESKAFVAKAHMKVGIKADGLGASADSGKLENDDEEVKSFITRTYPVFEDMRKLVQGEKGKILGWL